MLRVLVVMVACLTPGIAGAAERGCDKFVWPLEKVRYLLTRSDVVAARNGANIARPPAAALKMTLATLAEARLPMAPERNPKAPYAGYLQIDGVPQAGAYLVTLSADAWIDVVQGGGYLKPSAFTGALDCEGIRKSVRYQLATEPFLVQLSGATADAIILAVTPADE